MTDTDPAVRAIDARRQAGEPISYQWLRQRYARQNDSYGTLQYGTAILGSADQLDQYLWTYGPMVCSQWQYAAERMPRLTRPLRIVDHGCGQGLAGLLLNDLFGAPLFDLVRRVILIEPSAVALARAVAVYEHVARRSLVIPRCTSFDDLHVDHLQATRGLDHLHLFSNTLGIATFDAAALMAKALQPGRNIIVAVSPDRDFAGGTPRLLNLKGRIEHPAMQDRLEVVHSDLQKFICDNPGRAPAVLWVCEVIPLPRLTAWYGDSGKAYTYSGIRSEPKPWNDMLLHLKQRVEAGAETTFNSVLLNWYRDGGDYLGWHADDEKELGREPIIASANFGATRDFELRRNTDKAPMITLPLRHGTLLVMKGALQEYWKHRVPKRPKAAGSRFNLTFRTIRDRAAS